MYHTGTPTRPPSSRGNSPSYPSSSSRQDCGWLQVNVPYRNSHPHPPHGATHCPNPPPAPSRAVAGYTRWWMYCTETPTYPPSSRATQLPTPPNVLYRNSIAAHPIRLSTSPFPIYNRPGIHSVYCIISVGCMVFPKNRTSSKIVTWCRCAWNVGCLSYT